MAKTLWNKETGKSREYDSVDAREILANSPDLYTDVDPNAKPDDPDGDGFEGEPVNVGNVEHEFRREPVGDDNVEVPREQVIIRNPVTDQPKMAPTDDDIDDDDADDTSAEATKKSAAAAKTEASKPSAPLSKTPPFKK